MWKFVLALVWEKSGLPCSELVWIVQLDPVLELQVLLQAQDVAWVHTPFVYFSESSDWFDLIYPAKAAHCFCSLLACRDILDSLHPFLSHLSSDSPVQMRICFKAFNWAKIRRGECDAQSFSAKPRSYSNKFLFLFNIVQHLFPWQRSTYRNKEKLKSLNHSQHRLFHASDVISWTTKYVRQLVGLRPAYSEMWKTATLAPMDGCVDKPWTRRLFDIQIRNNNTCWKYTKSPHILPMAQAKNGAVQNPDQPYCTPPKFHDKRQILRIAGHQVWQSTMVNISFDPFWKIWTTSDI